MKTTHQNPSLHVHANATASGQHQPHASQPRKRAIEAIALVLTASLSATANAGTTYQGTTYQGTTYQGTTYQGTALQLTRPPAAAPIEAGSDTAMSWPSLPAPCELTLMGLLAGMRCGEFPRLLAHEHTCQQPLRCYWHVLSR